MSSLPYAMWPALVAHAETLKAAHLTTLFDRDKNRANRYTKTAAGITLDYSKNFFDAETEALLGRLVEESNLAGLRKQMFEGEALNNTEERPALHTLLRAQSAPKGLESEYAMVTQTLAQLDALSDRVRQGEWLGYSGKPIRDVLHIGIGGSYLGPKMVDEALAAERLQDSANIRCHYVANVDAHHLHEVLNDLVRDETLIVVVSKSFTTLETKANADTARAWLLDNMQEGDLGAHLIAVTSNVPAATAYGVAESNILPMWDWVGGRYSVWSAVGVPIALRYGSAVFRELLNGAAEMDQHFLNADPADNLPILLAFISTFYQHCFGAETHAVLTYDHRLRYLPDHLQQVDMESNGKNRRLNGELVDYNTGAIIWGGEGTNGQHAFHQLLHQGTRFTGIDFIATLIPDHDFESHHDKLITSCLSQSQALMQGRNADEISDAAFDLQKRHKIMPGNRPSNTLLLERLNAGSVGALIALYEHKVFCQAAFWQINPFDQWGVELGKVLGEKLIRELVSSSDLADGSALKETALDGSTLDGSTSALLARYKASKAY